MKSSGFTLIEVLTVLGILGILLLIGVPNYLDRASDQRALSTAHTLASDLRVAQREAVARRTPVTITFSAADSSCASDSASYTALHGSKVIKHVCLAPDVQFGPLPTQRFTFGALGIPQSPMTVSLRSTRTTRTFEVSVLAETGTVIDVSQ